MTADLSTDRLTLEALEVRHAEALYEALKAPDVHDYIETSGPWTPDSVRARLERLAKGPPPGSDDLWVNFAVLLDGRLVGRVEATVHGALAEVAYLFDPAVSGHGYATEAVRWLLEHLRATYGVSEVWATLDPRNDRSMRLLERCGFERRAPVPAVVASYDVGDRGYWRAVG